MIKKFNVKKTKQLKIINLLLKNIYKKPTVKTEKKISDYEEIVIVDFSLIGDNIMSIPFLRQIKSNCPRAKITMIARPQAESVLGREELVDEFVIFDGKECLSTPFRILKNYSLIRSTIKKVNRKKYDIAIEPKGDLRHIWFMHFIKSDRSISYNYTGGDYLVTDAFKPRRETKHLIDEKIDLLEMAGFSVNRDAVEPRFIHQNEKCKKEKLTVGIHPGASCKNKIYKHYNQIFYYLSKYRENLRIHVFHDPSEDNDLIDGVVESMKTNNIDYSIMEEKLEEYIENVSKCDLMICNDSSAGHIAAAYGIPVLVIFGAVKPETARPRGSKVICVTHDCTCKPCTLEDCPKGTYECLENIDINDIYSALEEIIGN